MAVDIHKDILCRREGPEIRNEMMKSLQFMYLEVDGAVGDMIVRQIIPYIKALENGEKSMDKRAFMMGTLDNLHSTPGLDKGGIGEDIKKSVLNYVKYMEEKNESQRGSD